MKRCRALQRRDGDSPAAPRRAERWELKTAASPTRPDGREPTRAQLYRLQLVLYRPEDAASRLDLRTRASPGPTALRRCRALLHRARCCAECGAVMPLPVLLNIGSALSAIFWPHAAAGTSGAAVVAGSANAAKDASVAGAAASGSSAAATGAKVRRSTRLARAVHCCDSRQAAHPAACSAEGLERR